MQKTRIIMGVLVLLGLAVMARLGAQQPEQGIQDSSPQGVPHTSAFTTLGGVLVSTQSLLGRAVRNPQGDTVGTLAHVIINPRTGLVRYAVVSMGGFLGLGKRTIGVPWEALAVVQTDKTWAVQVAHPLLPSMSAPPEGQKAAPTEQPQREGRPTSAEPERSGGWGAETPYGRLYDPAKAHTVHGTVVRVGTGPPMPGMASGIQLQVQTDATTTMQVHVGPEWYLERQELALHAHEAVHVTGALAEVEGQAVLLARAITVNGHTLWRREAQGQPWWSARRRSAIQ
jgi:sporulation protein YlmC with PRC-barrel domain